MKQGTQNQCSGTTQRDGVGREVGGLDGGHMYTRGWFMSMYGKTLQYCTVIILQLK